MPKARIEPQLEELYGDLDYVIPRLCTEMGQDGAARTLSTPRLTIKQAFISRWLKENGYIKKIQYVKKGHNNGK